MSKSRVPARNRDTERHVSAGFAEVLHDEDCLSLDPRPHPPHWRTGSGVRYLASESKLELNGRDVSINQLAVFWLVGWLVGWLAGWFVGLVYSAALFGWFIWLLCLAGLFGWVGLGLVALGWLVAMPL